MSQTQTTRASKPNFRHLSELIYSVGFYNRYIDQSQNKEPKTGWTFPGQPGEDEYGYTQGQRGYPIEGSSRPPADPRVQHPSNRPDPHSIPLPMAQERHYYSYQEVSNPMERESSKGDKYSRKPPKDTFKPYSSSSRRPADRVDPSSRLWEEDIPNDYDSSAGSGSETAALSPRSGRGIQSRGGHKIRSRAPPILTRPTLDSYHGSSNLAGLSESKPQQPWVTEPSGYKEKESARLPAQPSSSRADPRGRRADTKFVVGSYRGKAGGGLSGLPTGYQSRLGNRAKESARSSGQPSSSRPDRRDRGADTDFVVGGYQGEPGHPSDSQSRSGHREEGAWLPMQPSSNRAAPRGRGADTEFVLGSYRGEASGRISGHPSDSQSRSGYKEKESAQSSRQESRVRGTDEDYVARDQGSVGGYRGEAGGGISGHPSDSQSRSSHKEKESTRLPMQPSSSRPDPLGRAADTDFVAGGYRGEAGGGISGHPTDYQSRSGNREESARSSGPPSSSRPDPRDRGADTDFVVRSYRGEPGVATSGHPSDSQSRLGNKEKESTRSTRQESQVRGTDEYYSTGGQGSVGGYRGEIGSGISGPSDNQPRSGYKEKESARSSGQQSSSRQERAKGTNADYTGKQPEYASGGLNRFPYLERDNRGSTIPAEIMGATAHSSRSSPNQTTLIPQRKEDSPPYHTRGSGWGREWSSPPADPSRTIPFAAFPTTRPPQHEAQHSHPSQVQGSLGSQRQENTQDRGLERLSGVRDLISNPSIDATGPHPSGGQPTGPPPAWSAHPAHRVFFPPSLRQNF